MEKEVRKKKAKNKKQYYSYEKRIIVKIVFFIVFLILTLLFLIKSFDYKSSKKITYNENSNLDYQVCLKENNFYEEQCLNKDMIYVASLIDKVKINFNYNFKIEEKVKAKFNYEILAKLLIQDETGEHTYYEKNYILKEEQEINKEQLTEQKINENIEIDYNKYNQISNSFKNNYGISATSKLLIYFNVRKDIENETEGQKMTNMMMTIPLSERSVNVNMDYRTMNYENSIVQEKEKIYGNLIYIIFTIVYLLLTIKLLLEIVGYLEKTHKKRNKYDQYINKLLKEYDRLIVETTTSPFVEEREIIKVKKFNELLDVRDNLKEPIMYYNVVSHQKCYFYITHNKRIYLTQIKAIDMEENKK